MNVFNLGVYELKDIGNRFRNLFCRAYFRWNDETCTYSIPMHFKKPVNGQ